MVFVIHWHELAMDLHVVPIPIPPPTSLSTRSLWARPLKWYHGDFPGGPVARTCASTAGGLVRELRSHTQCSMAKKRIVSWQSRSLRLAVRTGSESLQVDDAFLSVSMGGMIRSMENADWVSSHGLVGCPSPGVRNEEIQGTGTYFLFLMPWHTSCRWSVALRIMEDYEDYGKTKLFPDFTTSLFCRINKYINSS